MEKAEANFFWKTATKFFFLTILGLASIFSVIMLAFPVLSYRAAANFYKKIGLKSAAVGVYERQYEKSNKIEDLYNLVLICDQVGNSEKLLSYSSELLARDDFASFEKAFNEYALKNSDKDKLYLVASLKNYLNEIRIAYKYNKSPEKAFLDAVACFEEDDANLFYFAKYISCILNQNASISTKKQMLYQAATAKTAAGTINEKTVIQLVSERYTSIKPDGDLADADLLRLEQLWQTKSIEIVLLEATDDAGLETARTELSNLALIIEAKINND